MKHPRFFTVSYLDGFCVEVVCPNSWSGWSHVTDLSLLKGNLLGRVTEGSGWTQYGDFFGGVIYLKADVRKQVELRFHSVHTMDLIEFVEVKPKKMREKPPFLYSWFVPPEEIDIEKGKTLIKNQDGLDISLHRNVSLTPIPDRIFYKNKQGQGHIYCDLKAIELARRFKWQGFQFRPIELTINDEWDWGVDYLGKAWPPQWWPDGYEPHPSNVMEGEMPDVKVGEGLVGEFAPPPKPTLLKRKPVDPKLPLVDPAAIRRVKMEEDDSNGWSAEIPLNRPLYDSESLAISLSQEDDDCPLTLAQANKQVRAVLGLLEKVLPQIEARLRAEMGPHKPDYEAFLKTLHSPSLSFQAEQMLAGPKWGFSVKDDLYYFQFDFVGDQLVDFCPVC